MTNQLISSYIPAFIFILLRVGIVIMLLPFFGSRNFPAQMKIGLSVAFALILTPLIEIKIANNELIPLMVMREIILGIAFGFTARFVFFAIEMSGQIISNAIGLSIAQSFNPEIGQSTEMSQLFGFIAMLIFLSIDAHHDLIYVFVKSYELLPGGEISLSGLIPSVVSIVKVMFIIALKLSAPVVMTMVVSHIMLGFVYKAAPQINIFFVAYPIYIFVGFIVLLIGLPMILTVTNGYLGSITEEVTKLLNSLRG
jgi:flagellar biosynthetic protein FliR